MGCGRSPHYNGDVRSGEIAGVVMGICGRVKLRMTTESTFESIDRVRERNSLYEIENMRARTVKIITFGCQMNENDSEKVMGLAKAMGFVEYDSETEAEKRPDLIILNTCCVRENAEHKLYGFLGIYKKVKEQNPDCIIAVCGCMMQEENAVNEIKKRYKFVDIVFGTNNIHEFPQLLDQKYDESKKKIYSIQESCSEIVENLPFLRKPPPTALVSVMYGCDNFCSYCVVPYVRGRERSRAPSDILNEIRGLAAEGYKEVTLLGQNVNSYRKKRNRELVYEDGNLSNDAKDSSAVNTTEEGRTWNDAKDSSALNTTEEGCSWNDAEGAILDFADLLAEVAKINGIKRIRFMTSHPKDLSDKLINTIRDVAPVCEHVHLPVQSGSNDILKKMNRQYTREEYIDLVRKIRNTVADVTLTTDIIVGFPGETEKDFLETLDLVRTVEFDMAYTFIYSKRDNTPAANYEGYVDVNTVKDRFNRLLDLQNRISFEKNLRYVGREVEALCEGISKYNASKLTGRSRGGKLVHFEGGSEHIGELLKVEIYNAQPFCLEGRIVKGETET